MSDNILHQLTVTMVRDGTIKMESALTVDDTAMLISVLSKSIQQTYIPVVVTTQEETVVVPTKAKAKVETESEVEPEVKVKAEEAVTKEKTTKRRRRRTKAEMEAARQAEATVQAKVEVVEEEDLDPTGEHETPWEAKEPEIAVEAEAESETDEVLADDTDDFFGVTPATIAGTQRRRELVEKLLDHGVPPNFPVVLKVCSYLRDQGAPELAGLAEMTKKLESSFNIVVARRKG